MDRVSVLGTNRCARCRITLTRARVPHPHQRPTPSPAMHRPESAAELPLVGAQVAPDPELEALPEPRRPGRRLTLLSLSATALASLAMVVALSDDVSYSVKGALPTDLGELVDVTPTPELANSWVRGEALLGTSGAVRYGRPLESDS